MMTIEQNKQKIPSSIQISVGTGRFEYNDHSGIYFRSETPKAVVGALKNMITSTDMVIVYYGDPKSGYAWLQLIGFVVVSADDIRKPLLAIPGNPSGVVLLDHLIVRIDVINIDTMKRVIYQHSSFKTGVSDKDTPKFEVGDIVTFYNVYGAVWPGKKVARVESDQGAFRYYLANGNPPWFGRPEYALSLEKSIKGNSLYEIPVS